MGEHNVINALLIILAVFLITLSGFLWALIRYSKNRIAYIKEKQLFQQTILSAQVETQEQTFENISQELHDNIGQQVTALNFQLEKHKLQYPGEKQSLDRISGTLATIAGQLQQLSHSLNSHWVSQQGLINSIRMELERLEGFSGLSLNYTVHQEESFGLSKEKQIVLFRIFQEILNNVMKHANASAVNISINAQTPFEMTISDNGKGFSYEKVSTTASGMGLHNIRQRAAIIRFDCTIESRLHQGTIFHLKEQ